MLLHSSQEAALEAKLQGRPRKPAPRLTILTGIKARKRGAQNFNKIAHASQMLVHIPEVRMDVITVPKKIFFKKKPQC